ncbi:MAG: hypothetical protein F4Y02_04515 [Chloroflexi bacterium]|nr:hypothetical protein [Chloroflexota bacterium]
MSNDPLREDESETNVTWLRRRASALGNQVVGAVVTTISLSLGYMVFNDYVAPPPDLSGSWKFTVIYEDTARSEFKDLRVTYQVLLVQDGLGVSGHGEKVSDRGPGGDATDYAGARRTNIEMQGTVTRNYLSRDTLLLHYDEEGRRRDSATVHRLVQCGAGMLCGCFRSTIADTTGSVWWQRRGSLDLLYEPVERPDNCPGASCWADAVQCS